MNAFLVTGEAYFNLVDYKNKQYWTPNDRHELYERSIHTLKCDCDVHGRQHRGARWCTCTTLGFWPNSLFIPSNFEKQIINLYKNKRNFRTAVDQWSRNSSQKTQLAYICMYNSAPTICFGRFLTGHHQVGYNVGGTVYLLKSLVTVWVQG